MASALIGAKFRAWANDGTPLAFGKVYTYETGTTVPKATYTTEAQTTPNANPVILNASGYADIYLDGSYKIVVKDADDVEIHTTDPVSDPSNVGASATLRNADTIQDLLAINPAVISSVLVIDYHGDVTGGGGNFVWDATAVKNTHNGGTIIDPDVTYPTDWTNQAQLAVWFNGSANVTTGCWIRKLEGDINPRMFGAKGDGVTDDSAAIQAIFNTYRHVHFHNATYLINTGITIVADNILVDLGNATILNGGTGFTFTFGATANTPQNSGLLVIGGNFRQSVPLTTSNLNYIRIAGFKDFAVSKCNMKNVSNGGLYVEAGCENGIIDGVTINGITGYATCRGIWINGATASDYASQLVDISSITRNATALPVYAAKNIRITNCSVILPFYGIYSMNSRDIHIENCYVDVSGGGGRCVALNNYSPGAIVKGNTFRCDQAATGVLVTQFSHDVIIEGNTFLGTFGGGRDIYVQYLADCQITNNKFRTDSTQCVLIDMGGAAVIKLNYFVRASGVSANVRCVLFNNIDSAVAGTSTYGNTATTLSGIVFANNTVKNRLAVVKAEALTATNGNIPGLDVIVVRDNELYNFDQATSGDEYGLRLVAPGTTYKIAYSYFDNTMYPSANANRNTWSITGSGGINVKTDVQLAKFRCVSPAGSGAITSTKLYGGYFSCEGTNNGGAADTVTISPRTLAGGAGAAVATPFEIIDVNATFASYEMIVSGSNYVIKFYNSSGVLIDLGTVSVTFDVVISGSAT